MPSHNGINTAESGRLPRETPAATHELDRETWLCVDDGKPFPCDVWKSRMLAICTPVPLAMTMNAYFLQACADRPFEPAGVLYQRFLGWIQPREFRSRKSDPPIYLSHLR